MICTGFMVGWARRRLKFIFLCGRCRSFSFFLFLPGQAFELKPNQGLDVSLVVTKENMCGCVRPKCVCVCMCVLWTIPNLPSLAIGRCNMNINNQLHVIQTMTGPPPWGVPSRLQCMGSSE